MKTSNAILQLDTVGVLTRMARSGEEQGKGAGLAVIILVNYKLFLHESKKCRLKTKRSDFREEVSHVN